MIGPIKVFAPATVANVACGFDIMGFAVDNPGDVIEIWLKDEPGVVIQDITGDDGKLPRDPEKNTAGVAVNRMLAHKNIPFGVDIVLHKYMPLGSGLGSSSASAVAGLHAVNELLFEHAPEYAYDRKEDLLPFAMEGERIACGSAHADNVAPALIGGFILVRSYQPLDVIKIPTPESLHCTIFHPHIEVQTKDARGILKKQLLMKDAIVQWGNTAGLIAGLWQCDFGLIGRSMEDVIVEPVRSILIPGFDKVKSAAMEAGALGCGISGSGPSLFALSKNRKSAEAIGKAMHDAFASIYVDGETYISPINRNGPKIIKEEEYVPPQSLF